LQSKAAPSLRRRRQFNHQRPTEARKRSTQRATDQAEPPRDPWRKNTAWRSVGGNPNGGDPNGAFKRSKKEEPFEAELLILFGLPTLIILISWAIKDPAALAVIPLAFFIPGIRDILLAFFLGMKKAKRFIRDEDYYNENDRYGATINSGTWSARPPSPPQPSRTTTREGFYDLSGNDFTVEPTAQVAQDGDNIEETLEEIDPSPPLPPEQPPEQPRGGSARRRWVSYNTSASFAEDEERKSKNSRNKGNLPTDDVRRLQNIPASPLAQVRWRDQKDQQSTARSTSSYESDSDEEYSGITNKDIIDGLDEELETLKRREERETRRQVRAARRQQRLIAITTSSNGLTTTTTTMKTPSLNPQQQQKQQQQRRKGAPYRISNSFWGDDVAGDEDYFTGKDGKKYRKKRRASGGVPWYARPVVSLFPFLKDWGGFM
jgi:hypothetical protein